MTPRIRKAAQDRKAEIVQAAIGLAGELGPDRVTTQHLADMVGVSQPAIFRHFPTKAEIWVAVGALIARKIDQEELGGQVSSPALQLEYLAKRHLGGIAQNPAIPAILFSRELHAENDKLRAHFEQVMENRRAGFAALVARAVDAGEFRTGLNPDDSAALILAAIQGLAMRWSLEDRAFDLTTEGAKIMNALFDGFRQP